MGKDGVSLRVEEFELLPVMVGQNRRDHCFLLLGETRASQVPILGEAVGEIMVSPEVNTVGLLERGFEPSGRGFGHLLGVVKAVEIVSKEENLVCGKLSDPAVCRGDVVVDVGNDERAHNRAR